MHIYRTDLNLLVVFDCIYTQGSVTRAAEVLHLTQPSVSHALSRLRDRVGDPLFVRNGQKLAPTQVAQKLIYPVRQALQLLESSLSDLEGFDPQTANQHFVIGMRPLMEGAFFPPLMRQITQHAPSAGLSSVQFDRNNLAAELTSGKLSVAIDVFLSLPDTICRQHLSSTPIVVVARRDHPAINAGQIDIDRYLAQQHLLVSSRPEGHGVEDLMLARQGISRRVVARCQQITTGLELVRQSNLLMTVAESLISHHFEPTQHQICRAPFAAPEVDSYLYWHASSESDKASQWLRSIIGASYQTTGQLLPRTVS
ncbi:LysR family transcriptional regulator [Oceanobacter antarcticus]|uniref:LysR family transcriptional regulator n=1 Tax=Oceanobacter antarcticus TaxID=3133425 RepID=A0ABW8NLJ8_9GAMM